MAAGLGISSGISDFGTAYGDLVASKGASEAAGSFNEAATLEMQNEQLAKASGNIQLAQTRRQIYQSESATQAAVGGAGLKMGGSSAAILRSSAQQGALATGLVSEQTQINITGYEAQAQAYTAQAQQEQQLAKSDQAGGIMSGIAGVASIFGF